ncbi:MAG: transcription termination/antitermination NusG family protein [Bryobacteraceae bacterium]|jgi:transcription antitermination factor NusG
MEDMREGFVPCRELGAAQNAIQADWYAVRVRSNSEEIAANGLTARGHTVFLPTYKDRRRWSDRIKEIQVPLFSGYVFCQLQPFNTLPVLMTPGVIDIVSFGRELAVVNERELEAVRAILLASLGAKPWPYLESGRKVLIREGPLRGVEGIVLETQDGLTLVVSVSLLCRSVSVKLDRSWVEPLSGFVAGASPVLNLAK